MKVLDARVDWMKGYANDPILEILVDKIPSREELVYRRLIIGEGAIYYAEKGGFVHFLYHNPYNEEGYGGRVFRLNVQYGDRIKTEIIKGPWSSRPGVINNYFPHCVEVRMTDDPRAFEYNFVTQIGTIGLALAQQAVEMAGACLKKVRWDTDLYYVVTRPQ